MLGDLLRHHPCGDLLFYTEWEHDPSLPFFRELEGIAVTTDMKAVRRHLDSVDPRFLVSFGDNERRERMVDHLERIGGVPHAHISDRASVMMSAGLLSGRNVIIMHYAHVSANSSVSEGSIVYGQASVGHDSALGRFSCMSAYSVGSSFRLGDYSFVGIGAVISPGVTVGDRCYLGGASFLTKDLPDGCRAVGNPARVVKSTP